MKCDICNKGKFVRRELGRYDLGKVLGLEGVTLLGAKGLVCDKCGEVMLDGEVIEQATEALNLLLVSQAGVLGTGEVRYLRKELEMTQEKLAERLGVHRVSVARWETGDVAMGQAESMALRAMVAMRAVEHRPRQSKEIASKFMHPTTTRCHGPYEITLSAA
jgi:putative zinc finger/helix-turn-helix YgiT family protein